MSALVVDLAKDAAALRAMAAQLDTYLYQDELYAHIGTDLPRLTVGGLLLRLHRLGALRSHLSPVQAGDLAQAEMDFEQAREAWAIHYGQKIGRELRARQDSLAWFLEDCGERDAASKNKGAYPVEAEKRTILYHLLLEGKARSVDVSGAQKRQLSLDGRLRGHFNAGVFLWPAEVEAAYPRDTFWWLYGTV